MDVATLLADLHAHVPLVAPSLLACDFADLGREIQRLEAAGAKILHVDVMDGHFVPNLSIGVPVVEAVRRVTKLPLDVHLMLDEPARYVEPFRRAGADLLTFHIEAVPEPLPLLAKIRALGAAAGIALSPPTPVEAVEPYLDDCDLVLTMSVMPGFGGQRLMPEVLDKLRALRANGGPKLLTSVDGGVNLQTITDCAEAGAKLLVTGTALLGAEEYHVRFAELDALATSSFSLRT